MSQAQGRSQLMAALEGLCLAKELGIRAVILKGDVKTMLKRFQNSSLDLSHNRLILSDAFRIV